LSKCTLEKTRGTINNGQSKETGYIAHYSQKKLTLDELTTYGTTDADKHPKSKTQYVLDTTMGKKTHIT
jgi:hypothetical protein